MALSAQELAAQRRITAEFVRADGSQIDLQRSEWVSDGAGGWEKQNTASVGVQTLRFQPRQDTGNPRETADGQKVVPGYTLLGEHTADVQRFDEFVKDGHRYEVVFVYDNRQYQVKAEVTYLGGI